MTSSERGFDYSPSVRELALGELAQLMVRRDYVAARLASIDKRLAVPEGMLRRGGKDGTRDL